MRIAKYALIKKLRKKIDKISSMLVYDDSEGVCVISRRRVLYICLSAILTLIFQEAFFNDLRLFNAKPNILLAYIYIIAVIIHIRPAMVFGLLAGLYMDIMYGRYLGVYALQLMLFAVLISAVGSLNTKGRPLWSVSIAAPSFFIYNIFESFIARLLSLSGTGGTVLYADYGIHLLKRILPVTLYDTVIFLLIFVPVRLIWGKLGPNRQIF